MLATTAVHRHRSARPKLGVAATLWQAIFIKASFVAFYLRWLNLRLQLFRGTHGQHIEGMTQSFADQDQPIHCTFIAIIFMKQLASGITIGMGMFYT